MTNFIVEKAIKIVFYLKSTVKILCSFNFRANNLYYYSCKYNSNLDVKLLSFNEDCMNILNWVILQ
ncbi:hypothetical protein DCO46_15680 [Flavobacterium sp. HTF]|nr:hypothetical protein DCO46_15680 [Flavobacterium sp. HTF]